MTDDLEPYMQAVSRLRVERTDQGARIEAAARVIDPWAFSGNMLILGCGGPWHYTGHSGHSVCPCGSHQWDQRWVLEMKQANAQTLARRIATAVLEAADAVASDEGEQT